MEYRYSNSKDGEMETQICYLIASAHKAIKWWSQLFLKKSNSDPNCSLPKTHILCSMLSHLIKPWKVKRQYQRWITVRYTI